MNNEMYYKYKHLLQKEARKVSNKFHMEYEECFSEACLILVKSFYSFNPKKAKFITHLYHNLRELYNFAKKEYPVKAIPENYNIPYYQKMISFSDEHNFSGIEKEIIEFVEKNSYNTEKKTHKHITKMDVYRFLFKNGYSKIQIQKSFYKIEEALAI